MRRREGGAGRKETDEGGEKEMEAKLKKRRDK